MVSTCPNNYRTKYISGHVYLVWSAHVPTTTDPNIFQATCTMYMASTCPNNYKTKYIRVHVFYVYGQHMPQQLQKRIYFRPYQLMAICVLCMISTAPEHMSQQLPKRIYFRPRVLCMVSTCPNNYRTKAVHIHATWAGKQFFLSFIRQECIRFRITYSLSGGGREDFKTFLGSFNVRDKNHITYLNYKCIQCISTPQLTGKP